MSYSTSPSEVTLISEDGIKFQVRIQVVRCIGLFKNLLELNSTMNFGTGMSPLQVPNVNSLILDKIIEYLNNYTASRENSALTKPNGGGGGGGGMKLKSIITGIQNKTILNDDDDEDGDGEDEIEITGGIQGIDEEEEGNEFEIPSDDENIFDFNNFDEQSLKLFTPYEQNFFGSLDIPTLIEITKVQTNDMKSNFI